MAQMAQSETLFVATAMYRISVYARVTSREIARIPPASMSRGAPTSNRLIGSGLYGPTSEAWLAAWAATAG
jgi:hypothetical protein